MTIIKTYEYTSELFTDHIDAVGTVRRVFFHALYEFGQYDSVTGNRLDTPIFEWHYYGTDPTAVPPPNYKSATIVTQPYVSFPVDFDALPNDIANNNYYSMAVIAGRWKEGIRDGLT